MCSAELAGRGEFVSRMDNWGLTNTDRWNRRASAGISSQRRRRKKVPDRPAGEVSIKNERKKKEEEEEEDGIRI